MVMDRKTQPEAGKGRWVEIDEIPVDAKRIGYMGLGGKMQTPTWYSKTAWGAGILGTLFSAEVARSVVSEMAREPEVVLKPIFKGEGMLANVAEGFSQPFRRLVQPQLWKSNLTWTATIVAGALVTVMLKDGIERRTFNRRHGHSDAWKSTPVRTWIALSLAS